MREVDEIAAVLGTRALRDARDREAFLQYLKTRKHEVEARLRGKREGGVDTRDDETLLEAILAEMENYDA